MEAGLSIINRTPRQYECGLTRAAARKAILPENYQQMVVVIAACESVDQCLDWSNQAEAIASYYRQATDQTLFHAAQRLRLRAIRRLGELLNDGSVLLHVSKNYQKNCRRVANISLGVFEAACENTPPPSPLQINKHFTPPRKPEDIARDWTNAKRREMRLENFKYALASLMNRYPTPASFMIGGEGIGEQVAKLLPPLLPLTKVEASRMSAMLDDLRRWLTRFETALDGAGIS